MPELSLVMPMAGRGTRFAAGGEPRPKPLLEIAGRPFFWWAAESVRRAADVGEMLFVVLEEHVRDFAIDAAILRFYPEARILALPEPTAGAAETAARGVESLRSSGPLALNDCDHAFRASGLGALAASAEAALVGFRSDDPAYSYVRFGEDGRVCGTVEKEVAGPYAIAGCYLFASRAAFTAAWDGYRRDCPYEELFVSGLYNQIAARGGSLRFAPLDSHVSFGTPAELARVRPEALEALFAEPVA
jgi:NDP-sugar pyrophosphorylase family protein